MTPELPSTTPITQTTVAPGGMFQRRIGRLGYFLGHVYALAGLVGVIAAYALLALLATVTKMPSDSIVWRLLNVLIFAFGAVWVIADMIVAVSLGVRRLHDLNQTGFLFFLILVPLVGLVLALYLLFAPGKKDPNNYGNASTGYRYWETLGFKRPLV
jgi:uncharacterized membrane protein YhaH (DUF805 family)